MLPCGNSHPQQPPGQLGTLGYDEANEHVAVLLVLRAGVGVAKQIAVSCKSKVVNIVNENILGCVSVNFLTKEDAF